MSAVIRLPVNVTDASLPVINAADIKEFASLFELNAIDHWQLGSGNPSFVGARAGTLLTRLGTVTNNPNYTRIRVLDTARNALISGIADAKNQTQVMIFRVGTYPVAGSTNVAIVGGSVDNVATPPRHGSGIYLDGPTGKISCVIREQTGRNVFDYSGLAGKWIFVALTESEVSAVSYSSLYLGSGDGLAQSSISGSTLKTIGNYLSIGQAYYSAGGTAVDIDFAEFIAFDKMLSVGELLGVYRRAKSRLAAKGIVLQ